MKKLIILAMVASFMIMSLGAPAVFAAGPKTKAGASTVQGKLSMVGGDYVIKSGKTTYTAVGAGLDAYVGKKVVASGKVTKGDKGKVLQVDKIDEVAAKKK
jgi:hypothetical protein